MSLFRKVKAVSMLLLFSRTIFDVKDSILRRMNKQHHLFILLATS
jgi:hypothetical protein